VPSIRVAIFIVVIAAVFLVWIAVRSSTTRRSAPRPTTGTPPGANVFADLRAKYFTLTRNDACPRPSTPNEPWGAIMEIGYPQQVIVTTVAFTDGTASVLRSAGGGFFGGGTIGGVKTAAEDFLRQAQRLQPQTTPTQDFPQPGPGHVVFYLSTDDGHFTCSASEDELDKQSHPFAPLYRAGLQILVEYLELQKQQPR